MILMRLGFLLIAVLGVLNCEAKSMVVKKRAASVVSVRPAPADNLARTTGEEETPVLSVATEQGPAHFRKPFSITKKQSPVAFVSPPATDPHHIFRMARSPAAEPPLPAYLLLRTLLI